MLSWLTTSACNPVIQVKITDNFIQLFLSDFEMLMDAINHDLNNNSKCIGKGDICQRLP